MPVLAPVMRMVLFEEPGCELFIVFKHERAGEGQGRDKRDS